MSGTEEVESPREVSSCEESSFFSSDAEGPRQAQVGQVVRKIATFTTNLGTFKFSVSDNISHFGTSWWSSSLQITVGNFMTLANEGFYDGIHFHRVIPRFICQFGCPHARDPLSPNCGTGGPPPKSAFISCNGKQYTRNEEGGIPDEMGDHLHQISNLAGTLSMANTGFPDSGGSQFFINVGDNTFLDWFEPSTSAAHPVFGRINENYNLVLQISQVSTRNDNPVAPIKVISIRVD
eukprot:scaffold1353_cov161-Amphora_coffeaeformis.AAC.13